MAESKNELTIANIFDDWYVMSNNCNPNIPTIEYKDKRFISVLDAIDTVPDKWSVWFNKDKNCYVLRLYYLGHLSYQSVAVLIHKYNVIRFEATYQADCDGVPDGVYIAVDIKVSVNCINGELPQVAEKPAW